MSSPCCAGAGAAEEAWRGAAGLHGAARASAAVAGSILARAAAAVAPSISFSAAAAIVGSMLLRANAAAEAASISAGDEAAGTSCYYM